MRRILVVAALLLPLLGAPGLGAQDRIIRDDSALPDRSARAPLPDGEAPQREREGSGAGRLELVAVVAVLGSALLFALFRRRLRR